MLSEAFMKDIAYGVDNGIVKESFKPHFQTIFFIISNAGDLLRKPIDPKIF